MKLIILLAISSLNLYASTWSSSSISLLRGEDFAVGDDKARTELSYENAIGYEYGNSFFWLDITAPNQKKDEDRTSSMYGEWSPRFSLSKIFGIKHEGILADIAFANTYEFGNNSFGQSRSNLHGLGVNLNLPGFKFFEWNLYIRDNLDRPGTSLQTTIAYAVPFNLGKTKWLYSAYIDLVHTDEGDKDDSNNYVEAHNHTGQQIKFDLGELYNHQDTIYIGFEYQIWENKYGIKDGANEYNLKYMLQWVF